MHPRPPRSTLFPYTTLFRSAHARRAVHLWRSREQAILVGSETALKDNPSLTVRDWHGPHPLRTVSEGLSLRAVSDRKSTRLNSSHVRISYAVFCLKKKKKTT